MQTVIKTTSFLDSLNQIIKRNNYSRIFIFTGSTGCKIMKENDLDKDSNYFIYSDFEKDPSIGCLLYTSPSPRDS